MKNIIFILSLFVSLFVVAQPKPVHNLEFDSMASRWDEGIPLGNGWLGALIWKKGNNIRLSLDRVDLWDDRPMPDIDRLRFKWIVDQVNKNKYDTVQKLGDEPYEKYAAPTKIPGAGLEFDCSAFGKIVSNKLDISNGLSTIKFENGVVFNNYIHASRETGYFGFENLTAADITPLLTIPSYNSGNKGAKGNSVEGQGLERLGYAKGMVTKTSNSIRYHQPTWNGNYYEVLIQWKYFSKNHLIGCWTISNNAIANMPALDIHAKEPTGWGSHIAWWKDYWSRSMLNLPDEQLEKQYYLEMYKFACVARGNTPPISLQAIWTADNGNLPPWKGDYHHDLNTQLSYWPGYAANHLDLTASYTNWLWKIKPENRKWTKLVFEKDGLNVPGVTTINGKAMGGWIQYSMSPTTAAWVAQHFYWQWKYSMDNDFLKERVAPYYNEIGSFLAAMQIPSTRYPGKTQITLSSSPEYHDNSINAWFKDYTNYDLALVKNFFSQGAVIAGLTQPKEQSIWKKRLAQLPEFDVNETGLTIAPGQNLDESHRHHAQLMAIYPLGLLNPDDTGNKRIMDASLRRLEQMGTRNWCGYSFSWAAAIYARAKQADHAANMLQIFSSNFCSSNSFHLNGDQKGGQYSSFTYRPFTLEGNFAFAQGVHEMLIQSYNGYIEIFPAVPLSWKDISFTHLRTEGAFLVSAKKANGVIDAIEITADQKNTLRIKLPFKTWIVKGIARSQVVDKGNQFYELKLNKGQTIIFTNGYE
jgi:alpha-L-fucosidase 2